MALPFTPPETKTDLVIIGAGATGFTIALELADTDIDFWILGSLYDSQIAKAGRLSDTYLPEGTIGLEYASELENIFSEKGINHYTGNVTGIEIRDDGKLSVKGKYKSFITETVVIATGRKQKKLGFEGEEQFFKKGISDCAVCDGALPIYRNNPVAIVGNHKYTTNGANYLLDYCQPVYLLWLDDENTCPEIEGLGGTYTNVKLQKAIGDEKIRKITFQHNNGEMEELDVEGLFVEGEPIPTSSFLSEFKQLELENGYVKVNDRMETSVENIWAGGEITGKTDSYNGSVDQGKVIAMALINYFK